MYVTNTMVTTKIFLKDGNRINKMESSKMSLKRRQERKKETTNGTSQEVSNKMIDFKPATSIITINAKKLSPQVKIQLQVELKKQDGTICCPQ